MEDGRNTDILETRAVERLCFPLVAAVVLMHTGSLGGTSSLPVYSTLCIIFSNAVCRIAFPLSFLFSGYVFFKGFERWDKGVYLKKLKLGANSLLIPYLLWNILAVLAFYAYSTFQLRSHGQPAISFAERLQQWKGLRVFWDGSRGLPLDFPLWFIRNLILFILASPFLQLFINKTKWAGIGLLGLSSVVFGGFLEGLFFFSLGGCLRILRPGLFESGLSIRWPSFILSLLLLGGIVLTFRTHYKLYELILRLFVISGSISVLNLAVAGCNRNPVKDASVHPGACFFIYASHGILIMNDLVYYCIMKLFPLQGETYYCFDLFLRPAATIAVCLGLYWIMRHIAPETTNILTGGRTPAAIDKYEK